MECFFHGILLVGVEVFDGCGIYLISFRIRCHSENGIAELMSPDRIAAFILDLECKSLDILISHGTLDRLSKNDLSDFFGVLVVI